MRPIRFDPQKDLSAEDSVWWADWSQRAAAATAAAISAWEDWLEAESAEPFKIRFADKIWGDLKRFLLPRVFYDKCAYCESPLEVTDAGDAEHFRPKGKVTVRAESGSRSAVTIPVGRPGSANPPRAQHPGYFWLAYDWNNLMPACRYCNSANGKVDQFPIANEHQLMIRFEGPPPGHCIPSGKWPGYGYPRAIWLDSHEQPQLLSPVNPRPGMEPREHLRFGIRGIVTHVEGSVLGEKTIRTLDLDRDSLDRMRARAQELAWKRFQKGFSEPDTQEECRRKALTEIEDFLSGKEPYSRAALEIIEAAWGAASRPT